MIRGVTALLLASFVLATASPVQARHRHHTYRHHGDANGNLICRNNTVERVTAYGIRICVDPRFAERFLTFFAGLKARGVRVTSIVCQAYGHAPGSNHIGGGACDVNQRARNRTIPAMYHAGDLIRAAGLYDGCSFRDCGHVEAMRGLGNYGSRTFAARRHRHSHIAQAEPAAHYAVPDRFGAGI